MIRLRVKEVAKAKGLSMGKLSRLSDVNYKTIKMIFADPYQSITTFTLSKLAKALNVSTSELIEDVEDKPGSQA